MNTRLWEAAKKNWVDACRDLLSYGIYGNLCAQVNSKGENDWTALHIAADEGHTDVCKLLIQIAEETDLDARTSTRQTPLHLASAKGFLDIIQILANSGADVNVQDGEGNTPLHLLSRFSHTDAVAWLLGKDPEVKLTNGQGKTAYEEAMSSTVTEVFEIYFSERGIVFKPVRPKDERVQEVQVQDQLDRMLLQAENNPQVARLLIDRMKAPILDNVQRKKMRRFSSIGNETSDFKSVEYSDFVPKCLLGKGSFGEVYLVLKRDTGKLFAMKLLRKENIIGQELMQYALAERNVLSYISHPFIVHLNWAFQTSEKLVLILDYCSGGDLGKILEKERHLKEPRARIYACEILLALEELHSHNILYRDLKPDNVVLDSDGHALLTDFGLSKENAKDNVVARSFCGSVAYLAPEVLTRQGHQKSVDWYLFGALIYEMIVGIPPYFSRDKNELFNNIKVAKLKMPKSMSPEAKDLIVKLMERNPKDRLGSGSGGVEEIKAHPFFFGIDWEAVYRRELRPPVPILAKRTFGEALKPENVFGDTLETIPGSRLENWSFVRPESSFR